MVEIFYTHIPCDITPQFSGRAGKWRDGGGAVRRVPPYGMAGGKPGKVGRNSVRRADGTAVELGGRDQTEMETGDVFVIETPGGGGYGKPVKS